MAFQLTVEEADIADAITRGDLNFFAVLLDLKQDEMVGIMRHHLDTLGLISSEKKDLKILCETMTKLVNEWMSENNT